MIEHKVVHRATLSGSIALTAESHCACRYHKGSFTHRTYTPLGLEHEFNIVKRISVPVTWR